MRDVPAAGTLPWRVRSGELEVALVHRPRYDDWSWPKGKLDPGEDWPVAAARETLEETGLRVRIGIPLPGAAYDFLDRDGERATKEVRYWAAEVTGGSGKLLNEIDDIAWLGPAEAHTRLDYARDRDQLLAIVAAHRDGQLATWPLLVVRHARALARSNWSKADPLRPLDARGRERADQLIDLIGAYAPPRLLTSPSTRCRDTLAPFAVSSGVKLRERPHLSEEGFEKDPTAAITLLDKVIARGEPTAVCTHRPLLPDLLSHLAGHADDDDLAGALHDVAESGMDKGESLVAHVSGVGPEARVVALERHLP